MVILTGFFSSHPLWLDSKCLHICIDRLLAWCDVGRKNTLYSYLILNSFCFQGSWSQNNLLECIYVFHYGGLFAIIFLFCRNYHISSFVRTLQQLHRQTSRLIFHFWPPPTVTNCFCTVSWTIQLWFFVPFLWIFKTLKSFWIAVQSGSGIAIDRRGQKFSFVHWTDRQTDEYKNGDVWFLFVRQMSVEIYGKKSGSKQ